MLYSGDLRGYTICSNPRSGSTYLVMLLRSTQLLGKPYEWLRGDGGLADPWSSSYTPDLLEQIEHVKASGATPNGVYGLKMFPEHFDQHVSSRWCERLPALSFVYLYRRDILGQAISLSIARQTVSYATWMAPVREAVYSADHIRDCLQFLAVGEARWRLFFSTNGIDPLILEYDEIDANPQGAVSRIAEMMDVRDARIDPSSFEMGKQRSSLTDAWRARFLGERQDLGVLPDLNAAIRV